jgi:hypothetical protein
MGMAQHLLCLILDEHPFTIYILFVSRREGFDPFMSYSAKIATFARTSRICHEGLGARHGNDAGD